MRETEACGSGDTKNLKTAADLPASLNTSSISQDLNNVTGQETNSKPIGNTSEINCSQTKSFQPPTSLAIKFAKRVAICTAVVAIAKYAYPRLMVTSNAKLHFYPGRVKGNSSRSYCVDLHSYISETGRRARNRGG